jgi:hypothetical protein
MVERSLNYCEKGFLTWLGSLRSRCLAGPSGSAATILSRPRPDSEQRHPRSRRGVAG